MEPFLLEWRVAVADFRLYTAQWRFGRALDELVRKYRPDQPRAPKGTPEGGQWVSGNGTQERSRMRTALAGRLIMQRVGLGDVGLVRHCTYEDYFGWQYTIEINAAKLCRPTYPTKPY
jgi:hypothetical protein